MKVLENTPAVLSLGKLCDENGYSYEWINGQKPHLIKNGIRIQCNTENFVPIVVPGLSASSSSGSDQSTSRILSRQESHCSTSSSSSSSSPKTATSSGNESREREDRIESDISPVTVSTKVDDRSGQPVVETKTENVPDGCQTRSRHESIRFNFEDETLCDRSGQSVVNHDDSSHEQTMLSEVNMDFRIPGLPHSVMQHAQSTSVRELIQKI